MNKEANNELLLVYVLEFSYAIIPPIIKKKESEQFSTFQAIFIGIMFFYITHKIFIPSSS